jgi:hypothetical protein
LVVHDITELYKKIYKLAQKVSKRDKFGIFLKIENVCLEALNLAIKAAFTAKTDKEKFISQLRVVVELLKNLVRVAYELDILDKNTYLDIQIDLQKISKMGAGWLKYAQQ